MFASHDRDPAKGVRDLDWYSREKEETLTVSIAWVRFPDRPCCSDIVDVFLNFTTDTV